MDNTILETERRLIKDKIKHDYSKKMLDKQIKMIESNPDLSETEKIMYIGNLDSTFLSDIEKLKNDLKEIEDKLAKEKKNKGGKKTYKSRKTQKGKTSKRRT